MFINPDAPPKNFPFLLMNYDDAQYRIFTSTDKPNCFLCKQEGHIAKDYSNPPQSTATNQVKTTEQTQGRTHEYINTANNTNIPPNISYITKIEVTNNHRKTPPQTDDLTDYELPNYERPLSVSTDSCSEDGNKYPFIPNPRPPPLALLRN